MKTLSLRAFILSHVLLLIVSGTAFASSPFFDGLGSRGRLFHQELVDKGLNPHFTYTGEVLANISGGESRGAIYEGLIDLGLEVDLEKLTGQPSGVFFFNIYDTHGNSPTQRRVGDALGVSNIDAVDSLRLFELWYEPPLPIEGLSLRLGQLAADSEFFVSDAASLFIHGTFGWAPAAVQSGAPAYPQASVGARLRYEMQEDLYIMAGVFSTDLGDPMHDASARHGTRWELPESGEAIFIIEGSFPFKPCGLDGIYKAGVWYDTTDTSDNRDGDLHSQNRGFYVIADQTLWTEGIDADQGLRAFVRFAQSVSDRNTFKQYFDAGFTYTGLFPGWDKDTLGIAVAHADLSNSFQSANGGTNESVLELTYEKIVTPAWSLQPVLQYLRNPGGPEGRSLSDAVVVGLRSQLAF